MKAAELTDAAALPRRNGELVFDEPWEARAFGIAVALAEEGLYEWEDFRQELIAEIARWEGRWSYYERWLAALERLLAQRGIVAAEALERRVELLEAEPEH